MTLIEMKDPVSERVLGYLMIVAVTSAAFGAFKAVQWIWRIFLP